MPYKNIEDRRAAFKRYYHTHRRKCLDLSMAWAKKNKEYVYEQFQKRLQNPRVRKAIAKSYKKYAKKNKRKRNVQSVLRSAIRTGKITRGVCAVCSKAKTDGHHEDYLKPLTVIWLCAQHHRNLHPRK